MNGNKTAAVASNPATVTVTGGAPNPTPTLRLGTLSNDTAVVGGDYHKTAPYFYDGGEVVSFQITGLPAGLTYHASTGTISGKPDSGAVGSYAVSVAVEAGSLRDSGSFTLTVSSTSQAVSLAMAPLADDTVTVGYLYAKTPSVTYTGQDTLVYAATGLPAGLSIDAATGAIGGTPTQPGTYAVAVSVRERGGRLEASRDYTLTVNSRPSGGNGSGTTGGAGSRSSDRSGSSGGTAYATPVARTQLPASAFSWDGERSLTINYDGISHLGLLSVRWDGVEITAYTVHAGRVIVRFGADFIAAQPTGEHTVRVEFLNHYGETTVAVGTPPGESYDDHFVDTYNPNTGGGGGLTIWLLLALGSLGIALLAVCRNRKIA